MANETGGAVMPAGTDLGDDQLAELVTAGVEQIVHCSVLTCGSQVGICTVCHGRSLIAGK